MVKFAGTTKLKLIRFPTIDTFPGLNYRPFEEGLRLDEHQMIGGSLLVRRVQITIVVTKMECFF